MRQGTTVDEYILVDEQWQKELLLIRSILLETEFVETIKWGVPVYTINAKNVLGIAAFKNYVGIWFYQGVFLKDEQNKLFNAQEGKTKALRQWRFANLIEIEENISIIKIYIEEAIENQKQGKELKVIRKTELLLPFEMTELFSKNTVLKKSFESLTKGKQREYVEYVSSAKRDATRLSRLEKITPMILNGIGLNDKYRKC